MAHSIPNISVLRDYHVRAAFISLLNLTVVLGISMLASTTRVLAAPTTSSLAAELRLEPVFADVELSNPLGLIHAPGDSNHWYVLEKKGRILQLSQNKKVDEASKQVQWRSSTFLDIRDRVDSRSEGGLLGAAFHPNFAKNGQLFVSYTRSGLSPDVVLDSILSRFRVSKDLQSIDNKTENILLQIAQPFSNHNGGQIAFSNKGFLFFGLGDGGSAGDPHKNGQNTGTLLGSMLRINVDNSSAVGIPAKNLLNSSSDKVRAVRPEVFAWGFRNPWRWSFDRLNGDLWVGDVGQDDWEEVDKVSAGLNYGWNVMEGQHCFNSSTCSKAAFQPPVLEYSHKNGRCSITGGYVYRGKLLPFLNGTYIYGDFCSGEIWGLATRTVTAKGTERRTLLLSRRDLLLKANIQISSFAEDNAGEIYVVDYAGHIYKIKLKN